MLGKVGPWRIAGTMSGTSLDGVDVAVIETDGRSLGAAGPRGFRPYGEAERAVLRAALGRWPGDPGVAEAAAVVEAAHAAAIAAVLAGEAVDAVAFHGQSLAHAPGPGGRGTHQAGDGARLAAEIGLPVIWDFRSADVAAGGQGAPLAPAYHFAIARRLDPAATLGMLNLGGVANLSWIDPAAAEPFADNALLAFDTGPANAPIDDLMLARRGARADLGGALSAAGRSRPDRLARWLSQPYFAARPPKSLDRLDFAALAGAVADLDDADAAATLADAVALSVTRGLSHCPAMPGRILVCGGGRHNAGIMARLAANLPCPVAPVEAEGLDGDMVEAEAFAFLAARVLGGLPITGPGTTGVPRPQTGGRVAQAARAA